MAKITPQELLKDRRVIEEIKRHLWIESEKIGIDVGFEKATEDWLEKFSQDWVQYHMPGRMYQVPGPVVKRKTRRAKSYLSKSVL